MIEHTTTIREVVMAMSANRELMYEIRYGIVLDYDKTWYYKACLECEWADPTAHPTEKEAERVRHG